MKAERTGDWKPVRKGAVYCSPACGHNCKHVDYRIAQTVAKRMATEAGAPWKPHVWENMGWHTSIKNGESDIICNMSALDDEKTYTAYLKIAGMQFIRTGASVAIVLEEALKDANNFLRNFVVELAELELAGKARKPPIKHVVYRAKEHK